MTRAGTIPVEDIAWIKIYHAKRYRERDMAKVLAATGGDLCFNGTIFSWSTYKPLCYCKADGVDLCKPDYNVYGLAWDEGEDIKETVLPTRKANCITCVPLVASGCGLSNLIYQPDMGGSRPRTAIGMKDGRFAYYTTSDCYTPEKLRDLFLLSEWDTAIMLDGGGSTCFRASDGSGFTCGSTRVIPHYIVVKLKEYEPKGEKPMVTINAYSKTKDGDTKLSTNFKVKEFACSDGTDVVFIAPSLVNILQAIRTHFGKAVTIHSGYRTVTKNKQVGGATYSQHTYGTAADISISGVTPTQIATYARQLMPNFGGVGIYSTFCHVDVRETKADWKG